MPHSCALTPISGGNCVWPGTELSTIRFCNPLLHLKCCNIFPSWGKLLQSACNFHSACWEHTSLEDWSSSGLVIMLVFVCLSHSSGNFFLDKCRRHDPMAVTLKKWGPFDKWYRAFLPYPNDDRLLYPKPLAFALREDVTFFPTRLSSVMSLTCLGNSSPKRNEIVSIELEHKCM